MKRPASFTLVLILVSACSIGGKPRSILPVPPPEGAVVLFGGEDTSKWIRRDGLPGAWQVENGAMVAAGGDIQTAEPIRDMILHVEFFLPKMSPEVTGQKRSNSGVYVQGRYEIQVLDSYGIDKPDSGDCGAIYKVKSPDLNACLPPDNWQAYDINFKAARFANGIKATGARVTVYQNGKLIHDDVEIPSKTGSGDAEGPDPRPLRLQFHGDRVLYRNIWMLPISYCTMYSAPSVQAVPASTIRLTRTTDGVKIELEGKPFAFYRLTEPGGKPLARPYVYPVVDADGVEVTADQVLTKGDHPHHRSLWVAHGDVNGADHWATAGWRKGVPIQRPVGEPVLNGDTLSHDLVWEGKGGEDVMLEHRTLRFFGFPGGDRGIDLTSTYSAVKDPVKLGDTKEAGTCAVRVAGAISATPIITNSMGQTGEGHCWGKPAEWCDISGTIAGKPRGIAVLDHPENPRHPSRWHVRKYGLLAANMFALSEYDKGTPAPAGRAPGTGDFTIVPGVPVTFRYRVVVHRGDATTARLDEKFDEFAGEGGTAMVPAFNGRDLAGWKIPSPNPWWTAKDGILTGVADPAMKGSVLETEKPFRDAIVDLECRWTGDCDSGVFLRSGQVWQCQIGVSRSLKRDMTCSIYHAQKGYVAEAKDAGKYLKPGEWNRIRISARGDRFRHWLNGHLVLDYTSADYPDPGPIGLQVHGGVRDMKIEFRDIRVKTID